MIEKLLKIGPSIEKLTLHNEGFADKSLEAVNEIEKIYDLELFNQEIGKWLIKNPLPNQLNVHNGFGHPPVTLFNNGQFVVDLYFWMHADTSIHSHSFTGAFKVLYGNSLHEVFDIEKETEYSNDVYLNKLTRGTTEILNPGDAKIITSGTNFNHRVVHLSSPTITLCVRTISDTTIPQWHYFDNGLSILKRELHESIYKKIFYIDYLFTVNPNTAKEYYTKFVASLDNSELMNLFEQLTVDTVGLSDDSQELLYNTMMQRFNNSPWFKLYIDHCENMQEEVTYLNVQSRIMAHAEFYNYNDTETQKLLKELSL